MHDEALAAFRLHRDAAMRGARRTRQPTAPVTAVTVDRRVWRTALALAGGDPRRIRVVNARRVEIM